MALWEQIAGISYSGDPRMSIPGAENPQKVKNIVRGEGVQSGLREMYKPSLELMQHLGLELDTESGKEWQFEVSRHVSQGLRRSLTLSSNRIARSSGRHSLRSYRQRCSELWACVLAFSPASRNMSSRMMHGRS